jgi:HNH endonuclease
MAIKRSPEMCLAAFFLARYGESKPGRNTPLPPVELGAVGWRQAYDMFWPALGDGRSETAFANSLKNARDNFDSHLNLGRIGWRAPSDGASQRHAQPLSDEEERIFRLWEGRSRADLWQVVAPLIADAPPDVTEDEWREASDDADERELVARRVRRGQPGLRLRLLRAYDSRCAITLDGPPSVLEAAHLTPHSLSGVNRSTNALLLRADIHCLYDDGLIRIDPATLTVRVAASLVGTSYWSLNGRKIATRADGLEPERDALQERWTAPE